MIAGRHIRISGIVQGVGFRPFVYKLANEENLLGWVKNTSAGVEILVEGQEEAIQHFINRIKNETPPLARIDQMEIHTAQVNHFTKFEIIASQDIETAFIPISPDISICQDCLRELFDPTDRRYLYPFINCTNCGPRFTITKSIPYDRPNTTMADFPLCLDCYAEYHDPENRRFHAQPVACAECGPHLSLVVNGQQMSTSNDVETLRSVQKLLADGHIVAIKGIGGFHLACDALNSDAVENLRVRKHRVDKPFALMMPDIETVQKHCHLTQSDIELLTSKERPIVLLPKRSDSTIAPSTAPHQQTLGVMLPYSPLHYLLFYNFEKQTYGNYPFEALVLTSGNHSEEPIATENGQALNQLAPLADAFLLHDRPIHIRCDDTVTRTVTIKDNHSIQYPVRRSRGYAPNPIRLPWKIDQILGVGAELKNTFCLSRDEYAFVSHHIGDLENYETFKSFEEGIEHFQKLFRIKPQLIAYDRHPNYLSTRYALERSKQDNIPLIGVQHHHAHIASCLTDNRWQSGDPVIGVAFDGTGYGDDGCIWGGEFLIASYAKYQRVAHLKYFPLPGGDRSIRFPARIALAYLFHIGEEWSTSLPPYQALCSDERQLLTSQLKHKINLMNTSSMGRLFDLVASLIGIRQSINYEAQAAIELEAIALPNETHLYPYDLHYSNDMSKFPIQIDLRRLILSIIDEFFSGVSPSIISGRFHNTIASLVLDVCNQIRHEAGIQQVALSGGVWQNITLLQQTYKLLNNSGFEVLVHQEVPANDGGISLGQVMVASQNVDSLGE